jgi:hypothetical protein
MFMRFRGGGIGHKATRERIQAVQHSLAASEEEIDEIDKPLDGDKDEEDKEDDSDKDKDTDSEEESDEDEENMDLEDGEGGCEDEYDALGYAVL